MVSLHKLGHIFSLHYEQLSDNIHYRVELMIEVKRQS